MTTDICKACGASLANRENAEAGDEVECGGCGTRYRYEAKPEDSVYSDRLALRNVPEQYEKPGVEEVLDVDEESGTVLYLRADGVRVRDHLADFDGDIPADVATAESGATEPEVNTE